MDIDYGMIVEFAVKCAVGIAVGIALYEIVKTVFKALFGKEKPVKTGSDQP